ncbi:hypothetical protein B0H16DRAFT_1463481 [Mycena metata]|uniref:Uncharacterized protein n=1 Tax=Mycena metata TaxID=1033252 RepID=A0AAD7IIR2_9AGAR|nr:hypothetical protein B0H16DRAFT_1463481 [Mycena metata]
MDLCNALSTVNRNAFRSLNLDLRSSPLTAFNDQFNVLSYVSQFQPPPRKLNRREVRVSVRNFNSSNPVEERDMIVKLRPQTRLDRGQFLACIIVDLTADDSVFLSAASILNQKLHGPGTNMFTCSQIDPGFYFLESLTTGVAPLAGGITAFERAVGVASCARFDLGGGSVAVRSAGVGERGGRSGDCVSIVSRSYFREPGGRTPYASGQKEIVLSSMGAESKWDAGMRNERHKKVSVVNGGTITILHGPGQQELRMEGGARAVMSRVTSAKTRRQRAAITDQLG